MLKSFSEWLICVVSWLLNGFGVVGFCILFFDVPSMIGQ